MTAKAQGAHHVGLTVSDLDTAKAFFIQALGCDQVGKSPDYPAVFISDGSVMITLWQAEDPASAVPFVRRPSNSQRRKLLCCTFKTSIR